MIKPVCLVVASVLSCNTVFCIGRYVARAAVEGAAYDYAAEFVRDNCIPAINAGVDCIQSAREQHQRETSEMIKEAVSKEDYVGAAFMYEGSDKDPGDGCVIA